MDAGVVTIITAFGSALISGGITLAVCIINNVSQTSKQRAEYEKIMMKIQAENDKRMEIMQFEISSLKAEVEKHNSVVERTTKLEGMAMVWETKLSAIEQKLSQM